MTYTVTGKAGETRTVTIKVTSLDTGKTGSYGEIIVNFPEDGSKATLEDASTAPSLQSSRRLTPAPSLR